MVTLLAWCAACRNVGAPGVALANLLRWQEPHKPLRAHPSGNKLACCETSLRHVPKHGMAAVLGETFQKPAPEPNKNAGADALYKANHRCYLPAADQAPFCSKEVLFKKELLAENWHYHFLAAMRLWQTVY